MSHVSDRSSVFLTIENPGPDSNALFVHVRAACQNGATPLFAAAQSNGAALARLLIQSNADVNRATNVRLQLASCF
eukprot:1818396-Rhodomonas_salina.8